MPARIGFLGAYSLDNPGDILVGYAARQAVKTLVPDAEQLLFAPDLPVRFAPNDWSRARGIDHEITRVPGDGPIDWARGLDALIVGGGGLLVPRPGFGPFLLGDPAGGDGAVPAAWNAICSQGTRWYGSDEYAARVRACCARLAYVSVRNVTTERFLRRCGYPGPLRRVPDCALLLDLPGEDRSEQILAEAGVPKGTLRIGLSVGPSFHDPRAAAFWADLLGGLARLARRASPAITVVLFPFARVYAEDRLQAEAERHLPGAVVIRAALGPVDAWRLVGRMDLYLGARLHAMIAAFTQETPFLVLDEYLSDDTASSKIRDLVVEHGLEPHYLAPLLSPCPTRKLEALLATLERGGRQAAAPFAATLAESRARLRAHYAEMLGSLGLAVGAVSPATR